MITSGGGHAERGRPLTIWRDEMRIKVNHTDGKEFREGDLVHAYINGKEYIAIITEDDRATGLYQYRCKVIFYADGGGWTPHYDDMCVYAHRESTRKFNGTIEVKQ